MGLGAFNLHRQRAAQAAPPKAPSEVEQLRREVGLLNGQLAKANDRIRELEQQIEELTAPPSKPSGDAGEHPVEPKGNRRGGR